MNFDLSDVAEYAMKLLWVRRVVEVAERDGVCPPEVRDAILAIVLEDAEGREDGHVEHPACWCGPIVEGENHLRHHHQRPPEDSGPSGDTAPLFGE